MSCFAVDPDRKGDFSHDVQGNVCLNQHITQMMTLISGKRCRYSHDVQQGLKRAICVKQASNAVVLFSRFRDVLGHPQR